jgi:CBS domain-containing protein
VLVRDMLETKGGDVLLVDEDSTVTDAVANMCERGVGSAIIADTGGMPIGIVTERDVMRQFARHGEGLGDLRVSAIMSSPVRTATPDSSLNDLMQLMTEHRFRHLPIVDDTGLVGIVSIGDVVKARLRETESEAESLREYISTSY